MSVRKSKKPAAPARKVNLPLLRSRYVEARRAWEKLCAAAGVSIYSVAAEGAMVGRGRDRTANAMKRAFDAQEAARCAWLGGDDTDNGARPISAREA